MNKFLKVALLGSSLALFATPSAFAQYFNSPSGNIYCAGDSEYSEGGYVSCFIMDTKNSKPIQPKPRDCDADWGSMFIVERTGRAYLGCYSDFPYDPSARALQYGQSINGNGWTCTSQTTGMRCVNKSGHGFQLNRNKQTLF